MAVGERTIDSQTVEAALAEAWAARWPLRWWLACYLLWITTSNAGLRFELRRLARPTQGLEEPQVRLVVMSIPPWTGESTSD